MILYVCTLWCARGSKVLEKVEAMNKGPIIYSTAAPTGVELHLYYIYFLTVLVSLNILKIIHITATLSLKKLKLKKAE